MRTIALSLTTALALVGCNQAPEGLEISITPEAPLTTDDLSMTVDAQPIDPNGGDNVALEIVWTQDGTARPEFTTPTVLSSATKKGEVWEVSVRAGDGKDFGPQLTASVTVLNAAPTATVSLAPEQPRSDDDLVATTTSADLDDDDVTLSYEWSVDGTVVADQTGATLPASETSHGETWTVSVTANDGEADGEPVTAEVVIENVAPVAEVVVVRPSEAFEDSRLEATATGSDIDGDELTWTYTWFVSGGEVKSGSENWIDGNDFSKGDNVVVEAVANDGFVDSEPKLSESVEVLNTAPTLDSVAVTPTEATETSTLTCTPTGFADIDGDTANNAYAWTADGRSLGIKTHTITGADFDKGQTIRCVVTPNDGDVDGVAVTSEPVTIGNTAPVLASASINPATTDRNSTLTASLGAVTDADDDRVEIRHSWTVNGSVVSTGTTLSGAFKKGDKVGVTLTPFDGEDTGTPVVVTAITIGNAAPSIRSVTASPTVAYTNSTISGSVSATDPDADKLTTTWSWRVNGTTSTVVTGSIDGGKFKKGDKVQAFATVSDGTDTDGPNGSNVVTIRNTPPLPPTIAIDPAAPKNADNLICDVTKAGTDLDSDTLSYDIDWELNGVVWTGSTTKTDHAGDTILAANTAGSQEWQCFAVSNDGSADSTEVSSGKVTVTSSFTVPKVGTTSTAGRISGDNWKVCRADTKTSWLASNTSGTYNAITACQSLGYTTADLRGGTCGLVCGWCGTPGLEKYDGNGGSLTSLGSTVHWRCTR